MAPGQVGSVWAHPAPYLEPAPTSRAPRATSVSLVSQGLASLVQDMPSSPGAVEARGLQATVAQIDMQSL